MVLYEWTWLLQNSSEFFRFCTEEFIFFDVTVFTDTIIPVRTIFYWGICSHNANFLLPIASPDSALKLMDTKKRGSLYLLLVPLFKASRIAYSVKNEQRRSPRRICICRLMHPNIVDTLRAVTYSHEHLSLLCFLTEFQVCETLKSQRTKRQINAF